MYMCLKVNDFNVGGAQIIVYDNYNPYRVAYQSDDDFSIRAGVYHVGSETFQFVFASPAPIPYVDIYLQSPYLSIENELHSITTPIPNGTGYYAVMDFRRDRMSTSIKNQSSGVKWFASLETTLQALEFSDEPEPTPQSGVVVTAIATPIQEPESSQGVVVWCNAKLLNPYGLGGDSEPGGGDGQFVNPTDPIPLPALPTHGVPDFIKLWNPSNTEMEQLGEQLFTGNIFTQALRDLIGQPIDYIVSLGIVPLLTSIGMIKQEFHLAHQDMGFTMYPVGQQYVRYSCGTVNVKPYWNSFLDFEPHTSMQIYLPFIGFRDILPSDIVGKQVTVTYHIDVFSGSCVAYISNNDTILYQYNGNCLTPIPFAGEQMQNLIGSTVGLLGSAATAAAVLMGGFGAGVGRSMLFGSAVGAASSVLSAPEHKTQHGGNAGGTLGLLSSRKPYIVLNRPRQAVAQTQGQITGFATWYSVNTFSEVTGFTRVAECHLRNIPATDWELQEIERLLKEGVIF